MKLCWLALIAAFPIPALAQPVMLPARAVEVGRNPQIDFPTYRTIAAQTETLRRQRLLSWTDFAASAARPDVLILDARSETAFAQGHIESAVNLPLPDFTAQRLAQVIGNTNRPILIYCNNNFSNNRNPVPMKLAPLALNIQTFINLVGYGYRNVYELGEIVDFNSPRVPWVRSVTAGTR